MKCSSCGHENREGARFCLNCGGALGVSCSGCGRALPAEAKFCDSCGQTAGDTAVRTPTPQPSPALPDPFAADRYQVRRFLGEGGRKRVYLAHDDKLDRDVAFALIKTEGLDADGLARVRREAQAMGRLGDHPHIVTIHDSGEDNGQPFIVSQYMAGGSVEDLLREQEAHRLSLDRALALASQVSQGLEHVHSQGVIHRDIKPGNIWLTKEGTAKLGDFGLAVALDRSRLTMAGTMVGTAAYMPPEQALGGQADSRSDLYSLGCVLYEMITGRPPFLGDDAVSVISQHINTAPLGPSWLNPEVPRALDRYVRQMLAKAPEERPGSAAEVRAALAEIAEAPAGAIAAEPAAGPGRLPVRGYRRSPFVGREKELGQLKERLEDALSGRGSVVMLVGEPGIGKTRLSEELSVYARLRGAQVVLGQCYESEGAPPYIPFIEALRQYVADRPAEALRSELGDAALDVAKLVSEVRATLPDIPAAPEHEPEAERYRLLEAVTSFLVNASTANPLLLILDDIHWADKPSLLLLQHLARRLADSRILVIGTYRDVELDRLHPLSEVLAQLRRERLYERILVRGLDADGIHTLISRRMEYEADRNLTDLLYEQTEGNPFFAEEIIFHLYETGAFSLHGGQYAIDVAALAEIVPEGVREVIGRRLSRLGEGTNQALAFASVLGREFDFDVLQALSEIEEDALLSALEEALRAQLIGEHRGAGGASYRFSHALVQETLYGELSIARKQRFHQRAGRAIEEARAGHLEPYIGQLANHFYQGNEAVKAIDYCRRAGEASLRVYAWEEALKHWETALEVMEEHGAADEELAELLERIGDLTYTSGVDFAKGYDFLERALAIYERLGARGKAAGIHSRLGRNMVSWAGRMDVNRALPHLEAARDALEQESPDSQALGYTYIGLALAYSNALQPGQTLDYARRARAIGESAGSEALVANAQAFEGYAMANMGRGREGAALMEEAWQAADRHGWTLIAFTATAFRSMSALGRRDPRTARRWLEEELSRPRTASAPLAQYHLVGALTGARFMMGDVEGALATGETGERVGGRFYLARTTGDWEEAETDLMADADAARRRGVLTNVAGVANDAGDLRLRQGLYDGAASIMSEALELAEQQQGRSVARLGLRSRLAIAESKRGRLDAADEQLEACRRIIEAGDGWAGVTGLVALAEGVVCGVQGRWSEAEKAFERALAVAREYGVPWDEADALQERARMYLARDDQGDRQRALQLLDETAAIYQRLGAKRDLETVLADKLAAQGIESSDIHTSIDRVAAAVQSQHPDLKPHAAPDGTVTIMFSDVEGSTQITERLGDERWMELLREHNAIVRDQIKAHSGFEVKSEGDGFMVAFQSARKALDCAAGIQKALHARVGAGLKPARPGAGDEDNASTPPEPIRVRIGLHAGETIKEGDDFFGRNVIMAARVAAQAHGGEILASSVLKTLVEGSDVPWADKRTVELKGLSGKHEIWPVRWRDEAA